MTSSRVCRFFICAILPASWGTPVSLPSFTKSSHAFHPFIPIPLVMMVVLFSLLVALAVDAAVLPIAFRGELSAWHQLHSVA
jgi:hypothetical protein